MYPLAVSSTMTDLDRQYLDSEFFFNFMTWQIGSSEKINCVIFNTIQGVFALSSYLDGLQPVFIYRHSPLILVNSCFQV